MNATMPSHLPQTPNHEELSQLLPSQWGMVHLFDLCLWFGHVDTGIGNAWCGRLHLGRPSRPWTIQQRFWFIWPCDCRLMIGTCAAIVVGPFQCSCALEGPVPTFRIFWYRWSTSTLATCWIQFDNHGKLLGCWELFLGGEGCLENWYCKLVLQCFCWGTEDNRILELGFFRMVSDVSDPKSKVGDWRLQGDQVGNWITWYV